MHMLLMSVFISNSPTVNFHENSFKQQFNSTKKQKSKNETHSSK